MDNKKLITKAAVYQVLGAYWQQYKNYPWQTVVAFLCPAIGNILIVFVPPLVVAELVNLLAAGSEVTLSSAGYYILIFGGSWLVGEMFWRLGFYFLNKIETAGLKTLSDVSFGRLTDRDYGFYTNNFVGSLTKKAISFARGFESFTDTLIFNVVTNLLPVVFAVIILWRYSPWIPLILLASILVSVAVGVPIVRGRSKLVAARHDSGSQLAGRISDAMTNIVAVKSFAQESYEEESFGEYSDDYVEKFSRANTYQNLRFDAAMAPLYVATNLIGLIVAVYFTHRFGLPAGVMVVVFSYYTQVTVMFWNINRIYRNIESSISEAAEFTQMLIEPPAVQDIFEASNLTVTEAAISFTDVNFKYNQAEGEENRELFFDHLNLHLKGGERVGLVGPSGGGKTTITKLLLRFINIDGGTVTIDGQDISQVTQTSLREAIAYVPQEPLLFHRSLFENIAYANQAASREEVLMAAKLAHADEFINELPHGYDTLVGERGVKLSGGQRQRVAIARALLKKASILVLDEATSALDSESEKYIQEGLWELMKDKTALVIAHRLSTIKHLDRIVVLDRGRIVEDGTHDELIKQGGLYAKLWSHQSGEFLEG